MRKHLHHGGLQKLAAQAGLNACPHEIIASMCMLSLQRAAAGAGAATVGQHLDHGCPQELAAQPEAQLLSRTD